jgi:hypothetical protein
MFTFFYGKREAKFSKIGKSFVRSARTNLLWQDFNFLMKGVISKNIVSRKKTGTPVRTVHIIRFHVLRRP